MANSSIIVRALLGLVKAQEGTIVSFGRSYCGLEAWVEVNGELVDGADIDQTVDDVSLEGELDRLKDEVAQHVFDSP